MRILIYGDPLHGFEFVGPFADDDAAKDWATVNEVHGWRTVEPEDPSRRDRLRAAPLCRDCGCPIDRHPDDHGADCPSASWSTWHSEVR